MFAIPAPVRTAGNALKEGVLLVVFFLAIYTALVAPPVLVAATGCTALQVWAIVVLAEFLSGCAVTLFGALFDIRPRIGVGLGLIILSVLNFVALPLYVLLGS